MRIGLFGLGHLGKIHFKCLGCTDFDIVGIYDPAHMPSQTVADYGGVPLYDTVDRLIDDSDACIIAAKTEAHYALAKAIMGRGKHCFIEKPIASSVEQAEALAVLADNNPSLITQIGFVERYNPAYKYLSDHIGDPRFIEVHRLAQFNPRGNDVSVVFDLMIHDLDLLLAMKNCEIKEVKATGVKVFTDNLDICNSRIEFADGSVANLTASRMSMKVMRKFRIFQNNAYLSMDLHKKEGQVISMSDTKVDQAMPIKVGDKEKHIVLKSSGALEGNAIEEELNDFYDCIVNNKQSKANIASGLITTRLAQQIEDIALISTK